jgi:hypothetical protein
VRWGGDEFICTISDADLTSAHNRFEEIRLALAEEGGAPVTVGWRCWRRATRSNR